MAKKTTQPERSDARRLYRLSLWSPVLLIVGLVIFAPFVVPYLLFSGFRSRHAFVRWHAGQWTVLTLVAVLCVVMGLGSDTCLVMIAIGGWYLGNFFGLRQANRGDCWLWRWWDDAADLPRPWAVAPDAAAPAAPAPSTTPAETLPSPALAAPMPTVPAEPHAAFSQGWSLALQGQRDEAVDCFLAAFRDGPPELRRRAVAELEQLGEVETF
jgi:hypothetical protein